MAASVIRAFWREGTGPTRIISMAVAVAVAAVTTDHRRTWLAITWAITAITIVVIWAVVNTSTAASAATSAAVWIRGTDVPEDATTIAIGVGVRTSERIDDN